MVRFIDASTLTSMVQLRGLDKGRVLYRLHERYCKPMFARGKCDYDCKKTCIVGMQRIFRPFIKTNDKEAVLVWRMREAIAATMETSKKVKVEVNLFGEPKFNNVFEFLAEEYSESTTEAS